MSARDFYADLGIALPDRGGDNVQVRCFAAAEAHRREDRNPSCSVNVATGAFNCFGCGAKGGPYDAAVALDKTSAEAMGLLRRHGLARDDDDSTPSKPRPKARPRPSEGEGEVERERYREALEADPEALTRLERLRGWRAGAIRALGLGLDGERVAFPVRDSGGALINLLRFAPDPARRDGKPKMLAGKGRPRDLFPAPETLEGHALWIVEGEPDGVAAHSLGLSATALPGTNGWRPEWAKRFVGRRVVIALDCDDHGRAAAERVAFDLRDYAADVRVLDLDPARDDGHDLGDLGLEAAEDGEAGRSGCRRLLERMAADAEARKSPEPENGATMLDDLAAFVGRYVVMSEAQAHAVALWIVHSHVFEAADSTPYLAVTSAEKRSGKTRLLEVLALLVARPLATSNITDAALFRSIAQERPTLLFDEIDAIFGPKARDREDLRGMVNAGHRAGAEVRRVGGANRDKLERFPVFCPKALAGIGKLPDTVADRAIPIRLARKAPGEQVTRARRRTIEAEAGPLRARVECWAQVFASALEDAEPELPDSLDDRAQDGAEPLLAISDLAGSHWPQRGRSAILELLGGREVDDDSHRVRLLDDVRGVFDRVREDRLATAYLLERLHAIDDAPWAEWSSKGLTSRGLSKLLGEYAIRPRSVRLDDGTTPKGYKREQFEDAWRRYLSSNPVCIRHTATTRYAEPKTGDSCPPHDARVADTHNGAIPHHGRDVADVAERTRGEGAEPVDPAAAENVVPFSKRGAERPATAEEEAEIDRLREKFGGQP